MILIKRRGVAWKAAAVVLLCNILHNTLHAKKEKLTKLVEDFTELEVSNAVALVLKKAREGEDLMASIEIEGIDAKRLVIKNKDKGLLSISLKKDWEVFSGPNKKQKVRVTITYNQIHKIRVKNAASLSMEDHNDELSCQCLELMIENASKINLSKVICEELKVVAQNASKVKIDSGQAQSVSILSTSVSYVDLANLKVKNVEIDATSASSINIGEVEKLQAHISSLAKVSYKGSPKFSEVRLHSLGTLRKYE